MKGGGGGEGVNTLDSFHPSTKCTSNWGAVLAKNVAMAYIQQARFHPSMTDV